MEIYIFNIHLAMNGFRSNSDTRNLVWFRFGKTKAHWIRLYHFRAADVVLYLNLLECLSIAIFLSLTKLGTVQKWRVFA